MDTDEVSARDRIPFWNDWINQLFQGLQVRPVRRHRIRRPHRQRTRRRRDPDAARIEPAPGDALAHAGARQRGGLPEDRGAVLRLRRRRAEGARGLGVARRMEHLRHHRHLRGEQPEPRRALDRDGAQGPSRRARPGDRRADGAPPRRPGRHRARGAGDDAQRMARAAEHEPGCGAVARRRDHAVRAPVAARPRRPRHRADAARDLARAHQAARDAPPRRPRFVGGADRACAQREPAPPVQRVRR